RADHRVVNRPASGNRPTARSQVAAPVPASTGQERLELPLLRSSPTVLQPVPAAGDGCRRYRNEKSPAGWRLAQDWFCTSLRYPEYSWRTFLMSGTLAPLPNLDKPAGEVDPVRG